MELAREVIIQNRYINLPVKNGAPMRRMSFRIDGEIVRVFDIELAENEPDFWVFSDVTAFQGQRLEIEVDDLEPHSQVLASITQSDTIQGGESLYREKHRPQFHFCSRRAGTTTPMGWSPIRACITCFTNTIRMAESGAICIGVTR